MNTGQRIIDLRTERNLSRHALAKAASISPSYLKEVEEGGKSPTINKLESICGALGINLAEFFGEEMSPELVRMVTVLKKLDDQRIRALADLITVFTG